MPQMKTPAAAPLGANIPVFPDKTRYADARRSLMALGYGPAPLPDAQKCDQGTDSTCFPEREACTGTPAQCNYFWRRGDMLIRVETLDNPPTVAKVECQVNCQ